MREIVIVSTSLEREQCIEAGWKHDDIFDIRTRNIEGLRYKKAYVMWSVLWEGSSLSEVVLDRLSRDAVRSNVKVELIYDPPRRDIQINVFPRSS